MNGSASHPHSNGGRGRERSCRLDLLYSRHEGLRQENLLTPIGLFRAQSQQGKPETIVREAEVRGNDLVYARLDNVDLRAENSIFDFNTVFKQAGLTVKQEFGDRWRAQLQLERIRFGLRGAARDDTASGSAQHGWFHLRFSREPDPAAHRVGIRHHRSEQLLLWPGRAWIHRRIDGPGEFGCVRRASRYVPPRRARCGVRSVASLEAEVRRQRSEIHLRLRFSTHGQRAKHSGVAGGRYRRGVWCTSSRASTASACLPKPRHPGSFPTSKPSSMSSISTATPACSR